MPTTEPLLRTKLRIPQTRDARVERPALVQRVLDGLRRPLTVIAAPAGFGKTTLAAVAAAQCGMPVAWVSLDRGDRTASGFLAYLAAAIGQAAPGVELLESAQPVPVEVVLANLVNDLDGWRQALVLALDDYHAISSAEVHAALAFLLEHQPDNLRILIATRSDPPLPLSRLRAQGRVTELRAADLRFSAQEAAQFLNGIMGLELDAGAVALLEERTEGWIAGLQMAALSLRDRADAGAFLAAFSGTQRYILDYLIEEVLAVQPPEVQDFLLRTSVLERLSAPLCAALAGDEPPAAAQIHAAADMLDALDRGHLFLVALDDSRGWYRYHHLFADLLRARRAPGVEQTLHRRAAAWLEANGHTGEAIPHALAAGEHAAAARMVENNTRELLVRGELNALMRWIEALPADLRTSRPGLCVQQAYVLAFAGRLREVQPLLDAALERLPEGNDPEARPLRGACAAVAAMCAVMAGQDARAVALAGDAVALLPEEDAWNRSTAAWARGYALRSLGNLEAARAAFEEQVMLARRMGNIWTLVTGLTDLANVRRAQGALGEARHLLEEALSEAAQQGARGLGYIARMEAALAGVLYEYNDLEAARRLLADAEQHLRQWPNPNHQAYAHAIHARVLLAGGDLPGARSEAQAGADVVRAQPVTRVVRRIVEIAQVSAGSETEARAILESWRAEVDADRLADETIELAALGLARAALAAGDAAAAHHLVMRVLRSARQAGHMANAAQAYLLGALAAAVRGDGDSAQAALGQALLAAQPGHFARLFLDEGPLAAELLRRFMQGAAPGELRAYAGWLLEQFPPGLRQSSDRVPVDPLSARELEVLALLAEGASNAEIARRLVLASGTVKAHTANIYRKLDAPNRTAAVTRARQLGLLRDQE